MSQQSIAVWLNISNEKLVRFEGFWNIYWLMQVRLLQLPAHVLVLLAKQTLHNLWGFVNLLYMSVFLHKYVYVHVCCVFSFKPNSPFPEMRSYPGITSQIFHLHPITTKTHTMLILQLDHFSRKCVWLVTVKPEPLLLCTYQTTPSIAACVSVCVCV